MRAGTTALHTERDCEFARRKLADAGARVEDETSDGNCFPSTRATATSWNVAASRSGLVVQTVWSPQGDRVAAEVEHGATGIWIAHADGSAPTYPFRGDLTLGNLVWSLDGRWLFVRDPLSNEISRFDPESGAFTALTAGNDSRFLLRPVGLIP